MPGGVDGVVGGGDGGKLKEKFYKLLRVRLRMLLREHWSGPYTVVLPVAVVENKTL